VQVGQEIDMSRILRVFLSKFDIYRYRRHIERDLALHFRGEARTDGLKATKVCSRLEIEWQARNIHPWDRGLVASAERASAFVGQSLADTEVAISRLFDTLPQVDVIALSVRDPASDALIIAGTVNRPGTSGGDSRRSIGMRLRELGLTYRYAGSSFEPLETEHLQEV
jgi:hypothetical protein